MAHGIKGEKRIIFFRPQLFLTLSYYTKQDNNKTILFPAACLRKSLLRDFSDFLFALGGGR